MTFREFSGKNVEEAIRSAMKEFAAELGELDIEILSQGSRGILGVGGEEARILAAPKSAVAAAETVRGDGETQADAPGGRDSSAAEAADMATFGVGGEGAEAAAEVGRADVRRPRGGRGRGTRGGRNGRERGERTAMREPRGIREPRPPREPRPEGDRPQREPSPFVPGKPLEELTDAERSVVTEAKSVLEELLRLMGVESTVEVATGGETARLNVRGADLGVLIGRRGEKLASLQHLVNLIVARKEGQHNRIAVDVENYRGRREEQLRDVADRAAKRVVQSGKIIQLEAMPAVERRIVHMALLENPKVRTQSVGVEPNRRIVVLPAGQVKE
jgi:spoIIIJ-associated protein